MPKKRTPPQTRDRKEISATRDMATESKKKRRSIEILATKICDRCKRSVESTPKDLREVCELQEFVHIEWTCGYASIMTDGDTYALNLCQHCVKELLEPHARVIRSAFNHA